MIVHMDIHMDLGGGEFTVGQLGGEGTIFVDTHLLKTDVYTTYCSAGQLRQLKAVLDAYLAGLPAVVDPERKEESQIAGNQLEP